MSDDAPPPVALSIAGSDNSAGAGIQADLKTFSANGVYGLTAVTCVVAEVPGKVSAIEACGADLVAEQVRLSLEHFPVAAIKTGMLFSAPLVRAVADSLRARFPEGRVPNLVVDPVMVASSGDRLLEEDAVAAYRELLFPLATILTPNLDEVRVLSGLAPAGPDEMRDAARDLHARSGCSILVKGGHLGGPTAVDILFHNGEFTELGAPFIEGVSTHGTGCAYSAAIAAHLALGKPLELAAAAAKRFVTEAIARSRAWQTAAGKTQALHHFHPYDP